MMPLADQVSFGASPSPPRELGNRIVATIEHERRLRRRRREIRFGFVLAGAAVAAIVAVLSVFVLAGGPVHGGERRVAFASLPFGMKIEQATLNSGLALSRTKAIVVQVGSRVFTAPVGAHGPA